MKKNLTSVEKEEKLDRPTDRGLTGYPSLDKPWMDYYDKELSSEDIPRCSAYQMLFQNNQSNLNDVALLYFNKKITYGELFDKIRQVANSLTAIGITKGDIVTIQTLNMPQVIELFYAINYLGAVANFLYITADRDEVHDTLVDTKSRLFITFDPLWIKQEQALDKTDVTDVLILDLFDDANAVIRTISLLKRKKKPSKYHSWKNFLSLGSKKSVETDDADLPAAMVYTSGTTGKSKAVVLTNHNLNALVWQYQHSKIDLKRGGLFMNSLPSFIAFGLVFAMHMPLCIGIREVIIPDPIPMNAGRYFAKYKPNYFVNGKAGIESIMNNHKVQKMNLNFVKIWAVGGEAISVSFEEKVNGFLRDRGADSVLAIGYGMTEVSATVVTSSPMVSRLGTVGIPLPATIIKIVNPDTQDELPYDTEGEVCINTPTIMCGYYNQPEETDNVLKKHADGLMWIHTGDIGKVSRDGFLSIVGRIKRIIEIRKDGIYHKVFPKLIEDKLEKVDGVKSIAIIGRKKEIVENEMIAFVVKEDSHSSEGIISSLKMSASQCLEMWERPDEYYVIDEMPRLASGKVDYKKLELKL